MSVRSPSRFVHGSERGVPAATGRLAVAIAALLAIRAIASVFPSMAGWGINPQRFAPPGFGWTSWALCALALVPSMGRLLARALATAGDALTEKRIARLAWMAAGAALVVCFPDRVHHEGDFLLRQGAARSGGSPALFFSQDFPLDAAIHVILPHELVRRGWADAPSYERILGAAEAAILAWLAVRFARELRCRGVTAAAVTSIVFFGGYLALFTGYAKAFREIVVVVAAVGVASLRAVRLGRGLIVLGALVAAGIVLHRVGLGLIPVWLVTATVVLARRHIASDPTPAPTPRGLAWAHAAVFPLAALVLMAPHLAASVTQFDHARVLVPDGGLVGVLGATFAPLRLLDLANMIVWLTPSVFVLGLLGRRDAEPVAALQRRVMLSLAGPFLALAVIYRPDQGVFRDWDVHAEVGVVLSLLAAWVLATASRHRHRCRFAAVTTLCVVVPVTQQLMIQSDATLGRARIEAFVNEPPRRSAEERAGTRHYLGTMALMRDDAEEAAREFAAAAAEVPRPGTLRGLAIAEALRGRDEASRAICRRLVEASPGDVVAWRGLMATSYRINDLVEARRAAEFLLRLAPEDEDARIVLGRPDSTRRTGMQADASVVH